VAGSLLNALRLPELVTTSLDEYEARALELATNPSLLQELTKKLVRNRSVTPLFDTDRFRRHIEAAYANMWSIHGRGEKPQSFAVQAID